MLHRSKCVWGGEGEGGLERRPSPASLPPNASQDDRALAAGEGLSNSCSTSSACRLALPGSGSRLREVNTDSMKAFGLKLSPSIVTFPFN